MPPEQSDTRCSCGAPEPCTAPRFGGHHVAPEVWQQSNALDEARRIRSDWIAFSYRLPEESSPRILALWSQVDLAMFKLIGELRA